ncbi:MAG TPA: hypothetical protein DEB06_05830 [Phycisphaerales bacterium]|nr:hypothetical protein [Phycisphaerales bacterium]
MIQSRARARVVVLVLLAWLVSHSAWAQDATRTPAALFAEASRKFDEGAATIAADRARGVALLDESVALFERVLRDAGLENGRVYYNIANARMLQGDTGRAVLNYRRAQRLMPADQAIAGALEGARRRVQGRVEPQGNERAGQLLLAWHYAFSPGVRFAGLALCSALFWGLALARLARAVPRGAWWGAGVAALVGGVLLGSLIASERAFQRSAEAVIVAPSVVGRKGPDESGYQPAFTDALHAGLEVTIVEARPGWRLVRLADGREAWLPEDALEAVATLARAG